MAGFALNSVAAATAAAAATALPKTHKSAVCLIPPRHLWAAIQEIRVFQDKSFTRWPPHINLLYPFLEGEHLERAAHACSEALRSVPPFQVTLGEPGFFEHGRSCTLWLRPQANELLGMQEALQAAFPHCTDLSSDPSRGISRFMPHLSLGQWRTRVEVAAAAAQLGAAWQAISFQAEGVAVISREGFDDPFTVRYWVPFGGGQPAAVDAPYIATVGESCCMPAPASGAEHSAAAALGNGERSRLAGMFGIGAASADGGVWNFAYGANMCPRKLNGVRGLQPLESMPARLQGFRLCFNHRGGMGNLVRLGQGEAGPEGSDAVHGVLHRLSPADYARLANMEHEYRPVEVEVQPYSGGPPVPAVAFVTPEQRCIPDGLPPPQRYLELLREGAQHWQLDPAYVQWLGSVAGLDGGERGDAYYTSAAGEPLAALPKIRTGSQPRQQQRRRGQQRRGQRQQPQQHHEGLGNGRQRHPAVE